MIHYKTFKNEHIPTEKEESRIAEFLYRHLEQYGDEKPDIQKAIDYALERNGKAGGLLLTAVENEHLVGAVVVNQTGMEGYIPENILVYIATHNGYRGRGIGKKLMEKAIEETEGCIALHVEPDNPAKSLYEKLGFTNKYLEMRLNK